MSSIRRGGWLGKWKEKWSKSREEESKMYANKRRSIQAGDPKLDKRNTEKSVGTSERATLILDRTPDSETRSTSYCHFL